jgi:hypothetical protein
MESYIYTINHEDVITSVSEAWLNFATENASAHLTEPNVLGRSLWSFISNRETQAIYQIIVQKVRKLNAFIRVPYRCDSAEQRRFMELEISGLPEGGVRFKSKCLREEPREHVDLLDPRVEHSSSFIIMCSWCKQVQAGEEQWLEVEELVRLKSLFYTPSPPKISHGVCPQCLSQIKADLAHFYPTTALAAQSMTPIALGFN